MYKHNITINNYIMLLYDSDIENGDNKAIYISNLARKSLIEKELCEFAHIFTKDTISIYVLKLTYNKYYVGKTRNIFIRYKQHLNGNGSFWTKKYKPIIIEKLLEDSDDYDEDKYVKIYMSKYGLNNVRGGSYIQEKLTYNQKRFLQNELRMANNLCLCCGSNKHFAKTCIYRNIYSYIYYYFSKIKNLFV